MAAVKEARLRGDASGMRALPKGQDAVPDARRERWREAGWELAEDLTTARRYPPKPSGSVPLRLLRLFTAAGPVEGSTSPRQQGQPLPSFH